VTEITRRLTPTIINCQVFKVICSSTIDISSVIMLLLSIDCSGIIIDMDELVSR
jgi:hypothetical protein